MQLFKPKLQPADAEDFWLSNSTKNATLTLINEKISEAKAEKVKIKNWSQFSSKKKKKRHQHIVLFMRNLLVVIKKNRH